MKKMSYFKVKMYNMKMIILQKQIFCVFFLFILKSFYQLPRKKSGVIIYYLKKNDFWNLLCLNSFGN